MTANSSVRRADSDPDDHFKVYFSMCQWPKSGNDGEVTITGEHVFEC